MWAGERESKSAGKNSRKDGKDGWKRERGDERVGEEEEKKRETGIGKEGEEEGKRERQGLEKRETGIVKEEVGDWKRGRKGRTTCSLQSETGRDNLLTVLLCYQQKGSRY